MKVLSILLVPRAVYAADPGPSNQMKNTLGTTSGGHVPAAACSWLHWGSPLSMWVGFREVDKEES